MLKGQAYPAVSYLMQKQSSPNNNGANITSMYPQALLKQYDNLPKQPNWTAYDMNAQFNSQIDWYFEVIMRVFMHISLHQCRMIISYCIS